MQYKIHNLLGCPTVFYALLIWELPKQGYLIGSGPVEGAIRHVIQQRLKLSGQRWTIKGAQQVASLRVAQKSNQWQKVVQLS